MTHVYGDVVTPTGLRRSSTIEIGDDGRIESVASGKRHRDTDDFSGFLIVPGFIDIHIHGGGGADFMDGSAEAVRTIARTHAKYGTTTLLATTLTASRDDIDRAITAIESVRRSPGDGEAAIGGIHLEGPYICAQRRGAQPLAPIRAPDTAELAHWIASGCIKKITLAPELFGATEFMRFATDGGVIVSIGHTDADGDTVQKAIESGGRHATHLFNAMSGMSHRSPGAVGMLLADDRVLCELICDGVHVAPEVVKIAIRAKGCGGIALITDAMSGATMPDGEFLLGGQKVTVRSGTAKFDDGTLAGSVLTMNRAVYNAANFAALTPVEASLVSSTNAAVALGLDESKGSIEPGKDADVAIIDPLTGETAATLKAGKYLYRR